MSVALQLALRCRKGMVRGCPCNQDVSCTAAGPQIQEGYGEGDVPVIRMSVAAGPQIFVSLGVDAVHHL